MQEESPGIIAKKFNEIYLPREFERHIAIRGIELNFEVRFAEILRSSGIQISLKFAK
jgi:hypothetical protein